jgi:serine/threonine protein kinase
MKYGRYEIVQKLGRGTMGVVYQAHDPQIDRMVALKVLRPDRVVSQDFVLRFLREAKAIGRMSHPNIVTVYDVGQDHGTIYIAMEYLDGRPLNEVIKDKPVPMDEAVGMCVQVADALGYAHRQGITHRDIKPSNIILTPDNRIKLTDFGIARIEDPDVAQQTQVGDILGTPVYMAPEQVMGQRADGRTDLYALGVIAYEMMAGKRPFGGGNIAAIFRSVTHEPAQDPMNIGSLNNRALADLILKSLSKDPANRFQTGEAMAAALKRCMDASAHPFPEINLSDQKKGPSNKRGPAMVIFFSCLVASIVGYTMIRKPAVESTHSGSAAIPVRSSILNVTSTPGGAQVFVDSVFKGTTPVNIAITPGIYEVRLNMPDYYEWEAQIQVGAEKPAPLNVRLVSIN